MVGVDKVATERQVFDWFRKNRNAKRQVLIFVHGYNNSYADAVFRFAQIVHDTELTQRLFSSLGHHGLGSSTIFTIRRAPTTRAEPWRT